ncbi:monovalent cation/H+ antiporter subunit D family protein [Pseudodesulfovibrio senegalensis]|jgi:multicomponent Na+:H+ antiporter subunit D|uniref:Monovalent cation/H+ antiporter subunit D family protein n=1 Tax=Pseudodesulfovibrio senegalensis TaxID=1721087 RepID=A0A6N6N5N3_9BACT|nr:monovalent cation/H+ antiporter subunit D family protein [Pseudodesulfovibrio senegalensis]KAB1443492.1 monovalent cation/H+ antiporter subunit D family protein [Pseudodesulfovibrio senegalensis]
MVNGVTIETTRLLMPVAATLVAPLLIWLARHDQNKREAMSFLAAGVTFLSVLSMAPMVLRGEVPGFELFTILPGIKVSFAADGLSMIFGLIASFLWIFATSYNIGYMRSLKEHAQTRYYICFAVAIFGAMGVAFAANVFTLYLFYEVITVFTYPLVAHHQDTDGFSGARKYIVYLMGTSKLFLLPAMVLTYVLTGSLDFNLHDIVHGMFSAQVLAEHPGLVGLTYILYIAGIGKAALMPFHNWLPSAMVAPTPVSALLHAVAVVKAGVFCVCRIILSGFGTGVLGKLTFSDMSFSILGSVWFAPGTFMGNLNLGLATAYVAAFTIVCASLIALTKDDIKARLAYSTVSQLSYVVIGVAMLSQFAVQGGVMHIAHHAFSKITLFFAAGAIYVATHIKKISLMDGLGRRMPWTFGAFGLASLSMIGVPPVCGFVSKWYLVKGTLQIDQTILLVALLASTALNAGYFVPILYRAFFRKPAPEANIEQYSEAPGVMVVPLFTTAVISVLLGLYPQTFLNFIKVFGNF